MTLKLNNAHIKCLEQHLVLIKNTVSNHYPFGLPPCLLHSYFGDPIVLCYECLAIHLEAEDTLWQPSAYNLMWTNPS